MGGEGGEEAPLLWQGGTLCPCEGAVFWEGAGAMFWEGAVFWEGAGAMFWEGAVFWEGAGAMFWEGAVFWEGAGAMFWVGAVFWEGAGAMFWVGAVFWEGAVFLTSGVATSLCSVSEVGGDGLLACEDANDPADLIAVSSGSSDPLESEGMVLFVLPGLPTLDK